MKRSQVLDDFFMDARANALEIAAFMDRHDRGSGSSDFRWESFRACVNILQDDRPDKTRRVLESLSDPTTEPIASAGMKGAIGAWDHRSTG